MLENRAGTCTGDGPCVTTPIGKGKNWVTKAGKGTATGGLPAYVRAIAQAQMRNGVSEQDAIRLAVGVVRDWANGKGHVTEATRQRARKALAEWEALKAKSHERTQPMTAVEYRTAIGGSFKDVDEGRRQVLVEFPHEVVDSYRTDFAHDCFQASFERRLPGMCWMHRMDEPIGRVTSAQVTARANELTAQFSRFESNPLALRAFHHISDGEITDFSFGFIREADEAHPEQRDARRITKARMDEISPVLVGSIPGARAVGVRSEDRYGLDVPDVDTIIRLRDTDLLEVDEARSMLQSLPGWGERIVVRSPSSLPPQTESGPIEARGGDTDDGDADDLAAAVDAALDEASRLLDGVDTSTLPDSVQQALALVTAAGVAVDDLLDAMGVDDPDETDPAARAEETGEVRAKYDAEQLRKLLADGKAIKNANGDPSFPIDDTEDLRNAIRLVGMAKGDHDHVRTFITKRAKALGQSKEIPADWPTERSDEDAETPEAPDDVDLGDIFARHGIA